MELIKTRYSKIKIEDQTKILLDNLWNSRSIQEQEKIKIQEVIDKTGLNAECDRIDVILLPTKKTVLIKEPEKGYVEFKAIEDNKAKNHNLNTESPLDLILFKLTTSLRLNIKKNNSLILVILDDSRSDQIVTSSVEVNIKSGVNVRVFEVWTGSTQNYLLNYLGFTISEGSSLNFTFVDDTEKAKIIQKKRFTLLKNAKFHGGNIWHGRSKNLVFENVVLEGDEADAQDFHICVGRDKSQLEVNYEIYHIGEKTRGLVITKGILYNSAEINFLAYAKVDNRAKNSDSYVEGKSLIMSEGAKSYIVPSMEIATNIVKAKHSASVSRIGDNELFYIMTRGIEEGEAKKMILEGFILDIASKFPSPIERIIPKLLYPHPSP